MSRGVKTIANSRKLAPAPVPKPPFTADDLISALSAMSPSGEGLTTYELSVKLGRDQAWVCKRVRALCREGVARAAKAPRPDVLGQMRFQPVYRLVESEP